MSKLTFHEHATFQVALGIVEGVIIRIDKHDKYNAEQLRSAVKMIDDLLAEVQEGNNG